MRRRRIDRCVLRAAVAIDARLLDDARAALEEVERLDPHEPAIEPLRSRLAAAELPAEPRAEPAAVASTPVASAIPNPPVPDAPAAEKLAPDTGSEAESVEIPETSRRAFPASAAAVLIAISGAAGWFLFSQNPPGDSGLRLSDTTVVYDSKTVHEPATSPSQPAVTEPAVQIAETAVTAAATSEPAAAPATPAGTEVAEETAPSAPSVEKPRPSSTPAVLNSSNPGSNTSPAASTPAPPPAPPAERRAVPASLDPSPSLPDAVAATPTTLASGAVPAVAGTEGVSLSGTSVPRTPPAEPPVPATPVATSSAPAAASPADSPLAAEGQVRTVLHRYEAAYSALDAAAASAVWPGVDRRALTSAFQALSSQSVWLGRCDVRVSGTTAHAECKGTARWQPKVGGGPQTAARQWRFDLRNSGSDWIITGATVR